MQLLANEICTILGTLSHAVIQPIIAVLSPLRFLRIMKRLSSLQGRRTRLLLGLSVFLFTFHAFTLLRYPAPTCDEAFYARSALRYSAGLRSGEIWPPAGAFFFVPHGRSYWLILSGAFAVLGESLLTARLASLIGLIGLVVSTYFVGRLYISEVVGTWSAAVVGLSWLSLYTGHLTRPDVFAAAANTATIGLLYVVVKNRRQFLYFVLGLAVTLQTDIHLNLLHFILPIVVVAFVRIYRERAWRCAAGLMLGLLVGGCVVVWLHLSNVIGQATFGSYSSATDLLNSYTGFSSQNILLAASRSLLGFWWKYYIWFVPFASVPHAGLFLSGLLCAPFTRNRRLVTLLFIALVSNISFSVVNQQYQLPGYAMLWLPLYTVMGVAASEWLSSTFRLNVLDVSADKVALSGLLVLSMAGCLYIVRTDWVTAYMQYAQALFQEAPSGGRVLAPSYWWFGVPRSVVFVDEHLVMPFGTGMWWNGVPELTPDQAEALAKGISVETSNVDERIFTLKPDYIVDDSAIGCLNGPDATAEAVTAYAMQKCTLVKTYIPSFSDNSQFMGRTHYVYACTPPR